MTSLAEQFLDDIGSDTNETPSEPQVTDSNSFPDDQALAKDVHHMQVDSQPLSIRISSTLSSRVTDLVSQIDALSSHAFVPHNGTRDDAREYDLVVACTQIIADIDTEIVNLHRKLKEAYASGFPELETLIFNPLDYARVARVAANQPDLTQVDLRSILPSGTVITVQVTASSSAGRELNADELRLVYELCDALTELDECRTRILQHVESRAGYMAPNLVEVVGGEVAAKLMGIAGGLTELARIPSCNVKVLGRMKKSLQGTSSATTRLHEGVVFTCPLVMNLPKQYRSKAGDVVSGKASLAARVDACREHRDGGMGKKLRQTLEGKFHKWQEPPPAKTAKPLPIPGDEAKRKHRGGQRARREKERMGFTDVRRLANRVKFGEQEEIVGNDLENEGFGMLGASGSNRLRVQTKKTDSASVTAKRKLAMQKKRNGLSEAEALEISGNAGNLSFTTVQGLELGATTPAPGGVGLGSMDEKKANKGSTYFSSSTPFLGLRKEKREIAKTRKHN